MMQRLDFVYHEGATAEYGQTDVVVFLGGPHRLLLARSVWENTGQPDKLTVAIRHAGDATFLAEPEVHDYTHVEDSLAVEPGPEP